MRVAGRLAAEVLDMIGEHVKPGVSTDQLDRICHDYIVNEQGAIPAPLNYRGFPKSICTSVNHVVCHGIPSERVLKGGDIVNIDITVIKDEYHGDTSRMFFVGDPPILGERLSRVCFDGMWRGIRAIVPGARLGDVGWAVQSFVEEQRFSVVREYCGHGIGRIFHEDPQVLHYGRPGTGLELVPGADGERRQAGREALVRRLDGRDQGSLAVGAVGAHGARDGDRLRSVDARRSGSQLTWRRL